MADYARGQRLLELREQRHESQETVAYAVGVSTKTLREWEHGGKIRWENAKRLAKFYGVDAEDLVSREEYDASLNGDGPVTQLDRIEQRLEQIYALLSSQDSGQRPLPSIEPPDELVRMPATAPTTPRSKTRARRPRAADSQQHSRG